MKQLLGKTLGIGIIGLIIGMVSVSAARLGHAEFEVESGKLLADMEIKLQECQEVEIDVPCLSECFVATKDKLRRMLWQMKLDVAKFKVARLLRMHVEVRLADFPLRLEMLNDDYAQFIAKWRRFKELLTKLHLVAAHDIFLLEQKREGRTQEEEVFVMKYHEILQADVEFLEKYSS